MGEARDLKLIGVLREVLSKVEGVRLSYLFGSHARGDAVPASDIDVALLADRSSVLAVVRSLIAERLGVSEDSVSVMDLRHAPPSLVLKVVKEGVKLVDVGGCEEALLGSIGSEVVEVNEDVVGLLRSWLSTGDPVDERVIASIIAQVQEDVAYLMGLLKEHGVEEVSGDEHMRRAFERALHTGVEGVFDLIRHVVSGLRLGVAEYYKDYVEIACRSNVLSDGVAEEVLDLVGVRHTLVHRYRGLNYDELWSKAESLVDLWPRVLEEVRGCLAEKAK